MSKEIPTPSSVAPKTGAAVVPSSGVKDESPSVKPASEDQPSTTYKVVQKRPDQGDVIVEASDGRMFAAKFEGDVPHLGTKVEFKDKRVDEYGLPLDPVIA